jgi:predicted transposase/invertase (TIGR01784 family)
MGIDEYIKMVAKEEGLAEGLEKGIEKGKEEQNRLFVTNLLKEGFPIKKIASLANVSLAFVKTVKADLKD